MIFESFTTVLSNGTEAEVVEGGAHIDVTWHNRAAYCAAVRKARLREGSTQTHAVLRGLNSLLPVRLLALFTLTLNPDPNPNPKPNPNRNPDPNPDLIRHAHRQQEHQRRGGIGPGGQPR